MQVHPAPWLEVRLIRCKLVLCLSLPSSPWSLCLLTAKLALAMKQGSGGQLAKRDKDKNWRKTDEAGPRVMARRHVGMKEGFDRGKENMKYEV